MSAGGSCVCAFVGVGVSTGTADSILVILVILVFDGQTGTGPDRGDRWPVHVCCPWYESGVAYEAFTEGGGRGQRLVPMVFPR